MATIRLENVSKRYGDRQALDKISFEVKDKEFFVLAGVPGSGKSSILRIIAGLETPDSGDVFIGDQRVNDLEPKDRDVSMVFENLALYPNKNGYDNIAYALRKRKIPDAEIESSVRQTSKLLLIEHLLDRNPSTYSGGELQRVALAKAMVRRPKVYLLDQPLANLDALIRADMRAELKRLVKDIGQTIIYTTHDQLEAVAMGERVAVIDRGVIHQIDEPETIYTHPKDRYVASFVGNPSMNFIDCKYETKGGLKVLSHDSFTLDVSSHSSSLDKSSNKEEVILGLRPEDLSVADKKKSDHSMSGEVDVREPLGSRDILTVRLTDHGDVIRALIPAETKVNAGDKVFLDFDKAKIRIFDKKTDQVLV